MSLSSVADKLHGLTDPTVVIFAFQAHPNQRHLTALLLALTALALSTLCAVLLIAARTPGLGALAGWGELFGRALVLHVSLAVVVWFLACAAAFWTLAAGAAASVVHWVALALALASSGLVTMVAPLFFEAAQPVLANYVPVLNHPAFFAGLSLFAIGVTLCGVASVHAIGRLMNEGPVWRLGALLSIGAALVAMAAGVAALTLLRAHDGFGGSEILAWGHGHVLQFVHVILVMSAWTVLGEQVLGQPVAPRHWLVALLLLAAVPVLAVPAIYVSYPADSFNFRRAFTLLMAYGCWSAAALLGLRMLWQLKRAGRAVWATPLAPALLLSVLLFLLDCVLGAMIRNDSTVMPAHYHGTVGAVTLTYMALGYQLLPSFGAQASGSALQRWQPVLYGVGLIVLALALAWSGSLGVPRKTSHVDVIVQYPAYFAAMGMAGLGGLLAIGGAALFVFNVMSALQQKAGLASPRNKRRDVRAAAVALTIGLTLTLGSLLALSSADDAGTLVAKAADPRVDATGHVLQKHKAEVDRRFAQGVAHLNNQQYKAAASELHRVLELAPIMPEAHVNMGFDMLGVQRYHMARDFFNSAIELNTLQLNAYFGLAVALEGLKDMPGALGAMLNYVHLSKPDDPYLAKANSAIWEWVAELLATREGTRP